MDFKDSKSGYKGPKPKKALLVDFIYENDTVVRSLPIFVGGFSLLAVLLNRAFFGIVLVTDAARFVSSLFVNSTVLFLIRRKAFKENKYFIRFQYAALSPEQTFWVLLWQ